MPNAEPLPGPEQRLDSWKEIAGYLKKGVRTVQRWERLNGLPVHRLDGQGTVYAYKSELDAWWDCRRQTGCARVEKTEEPTPAPRSFRFRWGIAGLLLVCCSFGIAFWRWFASRSNTPIALNPVPLTSDLGDEAAPSFSPDGEQVAYCANGPAEDNWDIYIKTIGTEAVRRLTTGPEPEFVPSWSPDGSQIAFMRGSRGPGGKIVLVPPQGGAERVVTEIARGGGSLAWSSDSHWIVTSEAASLIAVDSRSGEKRRLTQPTGDSVDVQPTVAPDCSTIVYVRHSGSVPNLYRLRLTPGFEPAGEPERLDVSGGGPMMPAFTSNGKAVVYSSGISDDAASLWLLPLTPVRGSPRLLFRSGDSCLFPATSRRRHRLAFSVSKISRSDVWRLDLTADFHASGNAVRLISSTHTDYNAQYSPNGRRIAFHSTRSGFSEIWVCDADGTNPTKLTSLKASVTGSPRWSPDGEWIAFDSNHTGHFEVYRVRASGGAPEQLTHGSSVNAVPSYSRDGRHLYFVSDRGGNYQIWKITAEGGDPKQITKQGGYVAWESDDARWLYFSQHTSGAIRRVPVDGGTEEDVVPKSDGFNFCIIPGGLLFCRDRRSIERLDFRTGLTSVVFRAERPLRVGLNLSPDGHHLLFSQGEPTSSDLMLVEGFPD